MDYLNELLLKLESIVERLFPKSQKKSERLQDLFQKKFGATEPCHPHPSSTVKIVDLLQNVRDNVFAEIISVDVSAFFAGKSTVELFVQLIPRSPVSVLNRLHMFAMFVSFEEAVPVIVPTMLPHRHMLLL